MPEKEGSTGGERSTSFLDTCKSLFAAITSALHTRLELLVTELEEERERLKQTTAHPAAFFQSQLWVYPPQFLAVALFWEKGWVLSSEGSPCSTSGRVVAAMCCAKIRPDRAFRLQ